MNKMLNRALMTLMLVGAPLAAHAEKIAVVDMGAVFEQMPQREAIGKAMEKEFGDREAEVKKLQTELRGLMEKNQRDAALMSETQKSEALKQMEGLQNDLQAKGKALQEDVRRRQADEQNKILVKVQQVIKEIAEKEQIDLVLQAGAVVYTKGQIDISSKVVEALGKAK